MAASSRRLQSGAEQSAHRGRGGAGAGPTAGRSEAGARGRRGLEAGPEAPGGGAWRSLGWGRRVEQQAGRERGAGSGPGGAGAEAGSRGRGLCQRRGLAGWGLGAGAWSRRRGLG